MKNKIIYFCLQSYEIIFEWWGQVASKLLYQQQRTAYATSRHHVAKALVPLKNERLALLIIFQLHRLAS